MMPDKEQRGMGAVLRALADPKRRVILDALAGGARTTGDLVAMFPELSRTGVMKHLDVLAAADLILIRREGRRRWNSFNPMPIQRIYRAWIGPRLGRLASSVDRLERHLQSPREHERTAMSPTSTAPSIRSYDLALSLAAPRPQVWSALTDELDAWWLADFRSIGPKSTLRLEARAGGSMIEEADDGSSLLWFTVHLCRPERELILVGPIAPRWGGPATSMLTLTLEDEDGGTRLTLQDALFGKVGEDNVASLKSGWLQLFDEGLKAFVERS